MNSEEKQKLIDLNEASDSDEEIKKLIDRLIEAGTKEKAYMILDEVEEEWKNLPETFPMESFARWAALQVIRGKIDRVIEEDES